MFGGLFGAFRSKERHFFNEDEWVYQELAKVLALRQERIALRRGRQYCQISGNGSDFGLPRVLGGEIRSLVPWSRLFDRSEVVLAINTDRQQDRTAWTVVDADLHAAGSQLRCVYSTAAGEIGQTLTVQARPDGGRVVPLKVPAAGL